jgi:hypothetical protein
VGNFQLLAEQVLRRGPQEVSCFLALGEETGNFEPRDGNFERNSKNNFHHKTLVTQGSSMETEEETTEKPGPKIPETFTRQKAGLRFPKSKGTVGMLEDFFKQADFLGLKLLHDDKCWLKTICISEPGPSTD